MNNKPLISVILPIYNIKNYLDACMKSLFKQSYQNLEFIMVDDGSTDGCSELCDAYKRIDTRVIVFHKTNGGLSDARNYGIERARGKYITCVDPDDNVDQDYIEYLYNLIAKYQTQMSICQHRVHYDNGTVRENGRSGDEKLSTVSTVERMLYHDVIDTSAWGKLYDKSLFDRVKYPKGKIFEDIGTTYKLMLQSDYIAIGYESKYNYIFHNNSIVNGKFRPGKFDLLEMTDLMGEDVEKRYPTLKDAVLRRRVYARLSTLNQMLNTKGYEKEQNEIILFIKNNSKTVMLNPKTPRRDRIALLLLNINYRLYRFCWVQYQKQLFGVM